jgi:hypothetical protein
MAIEPVTIYRDAGGLKSGGDQLQDIKFIHGAA